MHCGWLNRPNMHAWTLSSNEIRIWVTAVQNFSIKLDKANKAEMDRKQNMHVWRWGICIVGISFPHDMPRIHLSSYMLNRFHNHLRPNYMRFPSFIWPWHPDSPRCLMQDDCQTTYSNIMELILPLSATYLTNTTRPWSNLFTFAGRLPWSKCQKNIITIYEIGTSPSAW
jgi:hypothetical protein